MKLPHRIETGPLDAAEAITELLSRDGNYEWDEDGRDLSARLWNMGSYVSMHVDDFNPGDRVWGLVLNGSFDLQVEGAQPVPLGPGDIYVLDPLVPHGVPDRSVGTILLYVQDVAADTPLPTPEEMRITALSHAREVASKPPPEPDW